MKNDREYKTLLSLLSQSLSRPFVFTLVLLLFFFATEHAVEKTEIGKNGNRVESFFFE